MSDQVSTVAWEWGKLRPDLDLTGMAVFGRIARLADLRRARVYAEHGLQTGDLDVLGPLWRHHDGLRPRELRRWMLVGSGTLTPRHRPDRLGAIDLLTESFQAAAAAHNEPHSALRAIAGAYRAFALAHPGLYAALLPVPQPDADPEGAGPRRRRRRHHRRGAGRSRDPG